MTVRVRIAPSPTGNLHIGTARTAVFNWLFAHRHGGQFIVRIEDTDQERSRPECTQNILEGLTWLGLKWDEGPIFQSQRLELYRQAIQTLLDRGLAYPCYVSAAELEAMRTAQKARKEAPRYDNRHRHLSLEERAAFADEGRQPVIRFKIDDDRTIVWHDLIRGKMTWQGSDLGGDMVIARAAGDGIGQPLYNLAVVVDDLDMAITHVIRGEDHIANTAKQLLLYEALGGTVPEFAHSPLILNQQGQKLSKRDGATSVSEFQALGYTAPALVNYMALLGWSPPDSTQELFTLEEAASQFSFERVNKAGARFDWDKLNWINSQYIHRMAIDKLTDLLIPLWQAAGYVFDPKGDRPWLEQVTALVGPSLVQLPEAVGMTEYLFMPQVSWQEAAVNQLQQPGSAKAIRGILKLLEEQPILTTDTAQACIKTVTQVEGIKKGLIMRSLRAALTGNLQGPDLLQSWLLLHQHHLDKPRLEKALEVSLEPN